MRLLVNVRGCPGAGKTTIAEQLMREDGGAFIAGKKGNRNEPRYTVLPNKGWILLGEYTHPLLKGTDSYSTYADTNIALDYALGHYPLMNILMEGNKACFVAELYVEWFNYLSRVYQDRLNTIVLTLHPTLEVCMERLTGLKDTEAWNPAFVEALDRYHRLAVEGNKVFKDAGFTALKIDTALCSKNSMLKNFIKTCRKYGGLY